MYYSSWGTTHGPLGEHRPREDDLEEMFVCVCGVVCVVQCVMCDMMWCVVWYGVCVVWYGVCGVLCCAFFEPQ